MLSEIFGVDGIVVVIVLVAVLFGGAAIPKLARNLGSAKNEFEKGLEDGKHHAGTTGNVELNTPQVASEPAVNGK